MPSSLYYSDGRRFVVRVATRRHRGREAFRVTSRVGHGAAARTTESTFSTQEGAYEEAEKLKYAYLDGEITAGVPSPTSIKDAVERFCARTHSRTGRKLSEATARSYRTQLMHLVAVCGNYHPDKVGPGSIEKVLDRPASVATRAQWVRSIRSFFSWCMEQGWVKRNPAADVRVPSARRPAGRRILTAEECAKLLAKCSPSTRPRVQFALATGLRRKELAGLRWSWVIEHRGRKFVHIPAKDIGGWTTKSHESRLIPLLSDGVEALDLAKSQWPDGPFVLHSSTVMLADVSTWARDLKRAARLAEIESVNVTMHALRRTAGARFREAGDIEDTRAILGHADIRTTSAHYADTPTDRLAALADRIDERAKDG